jgi:iron(III) transport system substrate-binding protein
MFLKRFFLFLLTMSIFAGSAFSAEVRPEVAVAAKEGNLYIYGDLDSEVSASLVKEFETLYPGIKVDFITMSSRDVFSRHMNDIAASKVSADILWNSDITLQAPLVRDGYVLQYSPVENFALLPTANIGNSAFVTGFDPVVLVFNKKLVAEKELPLTRSALVKVLLDLRWKGKLGVCDPEKSRLAFLLLTQDLAYGRDFWGQVRKFGDAGLKIYPDYRVLLEQVESGELLAGYNLPLSEVLQAAGHDKNIGWLYMTDYTLAIPQTVLITKRATNPAAARLWIDFIRTKQAQQLISENCNLFPVRSDVSGGPMKKQGGELPSVQALKLIGTGSEVTRFSADGLKRGFLLRWKQLLKLVK